MSHSIFTDSEWVPLFDQAGYSSFDDWWNAENNLVETGNFRGPNSESSWSHVSRINLDCGRVVYLKRQQNHYPNNTLLKLLRTPTFKIEWKNYLAYKRAKVPTLNIVYFASRKRDGNRQCIIVSEELKGMTPVYDLINSFKQYGWPPRKQRFAILGAIVKVVRQLHDAGMIHNALYSRHIYLNITIVNGQAVIPDHIQACLIDLMSFGCKLLISSFIFVTLL